MIFSKIVGGPDLNDVEQFEAVLHGVTLKYARLSASQSGQAKVQVVNYLQQQHKFEPNEYGRGIYKIDGGYWEYGNCLRFLNHLPSLAGYFRFRIYLTKKDSRQSLKAYLESYLNNWLAEKNKNRDVNDEMDKKYIVAFPKLIPIKISGYDGFYYRLHGVPSRLRYTDYRVISINNEYMLNLEIAPKASGKDQWIKIVNELNEKATKTIVDSLELVSS